jgi:cbb3-type cytochrome oxidase subunit 3
MRAFASTLLLILLALAAPVLVVWVVWALWRHERKIARRKAAARG